MSWQAIALMSDKIVHVAVGVILRCLDDDLIPKVYLTRRADNVHQGGKWEFPGGKVELNESAESALLRELSEEVGIVVTASEHLMDVKHDYVDKHVWLDIHLVLGFENEPFGQEGQIGQWYPINTLRTLDFPDANNAIISALEHRYLA